MKIILAVDGSPYSEWAADLLLGLPLAQEPQILVMQVVERAIVPPLIHSSLVQQYHEVVQKLLQGSLEDARQYTSRIARRLREHWKEVRPLVVTGSASEKIIERAREEKTDLIILGSRGLSNIQAFLLGSTSQKVVTYAPCSVLVVKRKPRAFQKVLLAVDGSQNSERALEFLTSTFQPQGIHTTVLYVWNYSFNPPKGLPKFATIEGRYCEAIRQAGFEARASFKTGHPAVRIVEAAHRRRVDLVVLGSRGLSSWKQFLMGSVSQKAVKYCQRSVLVVRK